MTRQPRPASDIDLLLVATGLPDGRRARLGEFMHDERHLELLLAAARRDGVHTDIAPVFRTPQALQQGSLLFLDVTDQAVILHDADRLFRTYLDDWSQRLRTMGARRIYKGGATIGSASPISRRAIGTNYACR